MSKKALSPSDGTKCIVDLSFHSRCRCIEHCNYYIKYLCDNWASNKRDIITSYKCFKIISREGSDCLWRLVLLNLQGDEVVKIIIVSDGFYNNYVNILQSSGKWTNRGQPSKRRPQACCHGNRPSECCWRRRTARDFGHRRRTKEWRRRFPGGILGNRGL